MYGIFGVGRFIPPLKLVHQLRLVLLVVENYPFQMADNQRSRQQQNHANRFEHKQLQIEGRNKFTFLSIRIEI